MGNAGTEEIHWVVGAAGRLFYEGLQAMCQD